MKKVLMTTALTLALSMAAVPVMAGTWGEGLGPEHPYAGLPIVEDLSRSLGYLLFYPNDVHKNLQVKHYCDMLVMYLPREDVTRGTGQIHLYDEEGEIFSWSFENEEDVTIRELNEDELDILGWGGGTFIGTSKLPVSLDFGKTYHVLMDSGCFTAANGAVKNPAVDQDNEWVFTLHGDYGITNRTYRRPEADETAEETDSAAEGTEEAAEESDTSGTEEGEAENSDAEAAAGEDTAVEAEEEFDPEKLGEAVTKPTKGDTLVFDLVIGGNAVSALTFSDNGSVQALNDGKTHTTSETLVAEITDYEVDWGVIFYDSEGNVCNVLREKF